MWFKFLAQRQKARASGVKVGKYIPVQVLCLVCTVETVLWFCAVALLQIILFILYYFGSPRTCFDLGKIDLVKVPPS